MGQVGSKEQQHALLDLLSIDAIGYSYLSQPDSVQYQSISRRFQLFILHYPPHIVNENQHILEIKDSKSLQICYMCLQHLVPLHQDSKILIILILECCQRLLLSRELFKCTSQYSISPLLQCLKLNGDIATHALKVLCHMSTYYGTRTDKDLKMEWKNEHYLMKEMGYDAIVNIWTFDHNNEEEENSEILKLSLSMIVSLLRKRGSLYENTILRHVVQLVQDQWHPILELCRHTSVAHTAAKVVTELFLLSDMAQILHMQNTARSSGALLWIFQAAISEALCDEHNLYGFVQVFEMICVGNKETEICLRRMLPMNDLVAYGQIPVTVSSNSLIKTTTTRRRSISLNFDFEFPLTNRRRRSSEEFDFGEWLLKNREQGFPWQAVPYAVIRFCTCPKLIWQQEMLNELQNAMTNEIDLVDKNRVETEDSCTPWNSSKVHYTSLHLQLQVYGYFIEPLVPILENLTKAFVINDPVLFCWHLFDRIVEETNSFNRLQLIKTLRLLFMRHGLLLHGNLPLRYFLRTLKSSFPPSEWNIFHEILSLVQTAIMSKTSDELALEMVRGDLIPLLVSVLGYENCTVEVSKSQLVAIELIVEIVKRATVVLHSFDSQIQTIVLPLMKSIVVHSTNGSKNSERFLSAYLELFTLIVKAHPNMKKELQHYGLLQCILWTISYYDNTISEQVASDAVEFLRDVSDSCLTGWIPLPMIELLKTNQCETFTHLFFNDVVEYSDVMWTAAMRKALQEALTRDLLPSMKSEHNSLFPDYVACLPQEIIVGGVYLHAYVIDKAPFALDWNIQRWQTFVNDLETALGNLLCITPTFGNQMDPSDEYYLKNNILGCQSLILQSIDSAITYLPEIKLPDRVFDHLLIPLQSRLQYPQQAERCIFVLKIILHVLKAAELSVNYEPCLEFLQNRGIQGILSALGRTLEPFFPRLVQEEEHVPLVVRMLLETLHFISTLENGSELLATHRIGMSLLLKMVAPCRIAEYPTTAILVLQMLEEWIQKESLQNLFIQVGGLIHTSRSIVLSEPVSSSSFRKVLLLSARLLVICMQTPLPRLILEQLFTPGLLRILEKDESVFVDHFQHQIFSNSPTLIWTRSMQDLLHSTLHLEARKLITSPTNWVIDDFIAANSFKYAYPELKDELEIDGIYIEKFLHSDSPWTTLTSIDWMSFSESLCLAINSMKERMSLVNNQDEYEPQTAVVQHERLMKMKDTLRQIISHRPECNHIMMEEFEEDDFTV